MKLKSRFAAPAVLALILMGSLLAYGVSYRSESAYGRIEFPGADSPIIICFRSRLAAIVFEPAALAESFLRGRSIARTFEMSVPETVQ